MNIFSGRHSNNDGSTILKARRSTIATPPSFRVAYLYSVFPYIPPPPPATSRTPFCSYVASDKRSGLVKMGGYSSTVIPTSHGTSFRDLKVVEHHMQPTRTKSTSSDTRPLFSSRIVSNLRPNYTLRQRCLGPKQNFKEEALEEKLQ